MLYNLNSVVFSYFQESQVPDPSDLFTNVYVKGLGVEVKIISSLLIIHSCISLKIPDLYLKIHVMHIPYSIILFSKKLGKEKLLIVAVTLMTILQLSCMGFELCALRLQSQAVPLS
jgi:hypothetical protein